MKNYLISYNAGSSFGNIEIYGTHLRLNKELLDLARNYIKDDLTKKGIQFDGVIILNVVKLEK